MLAGLREALGLVTTRGRRDTQFTDHGRDPDAARHLGSLAEAPSKVNLDADVDVLLDRTCCRLISGTRDDTKRGLAVTVDTPGAHSPPVIKHNRARSVTDRLMFSY